MLMLLFLGTSAFADPPRRVVSFNQCGDQLLVALADPDQIAGLSPYATDPTLSVVADKAQGYRKLDWQAESTIALQPDLVLIGEYDRPVTKHILRSQGLRLHELGLISDLDVARRQVTEVAALLGHPERGEKLNAEIDEARARLHAVPLPPLLHTALLVNRGGYTAGERSLVATLLAEAGLKPPPGSPGGYGAYVPLEKLLMLHPDLIVFNSEPRQSDQGSYNLSHPALDAIYPPERRIVLPPRYTICGGPALVAAFDYLAGLLTRLAQSPTMRTN
jgi:iron complex transport system substrate-binding protein